MMTLEQLLGACGEHGECDCPQCKPQKIDPEAAVMELCGAFAAFVQPCPFKPGQLVTPRSNSTTRGAGEPHIVLTVLSAPIKIDWCSDPGDATTNAFGRVVDMRVACVVNGNVSAHMVESWQFEPYTGAGAGLV